MPKTAVALFNNPALGEDVVREIEKLGIPKENVRALEEPRKFPVNGVMSFARLEFEVELKHALGEIGASDSEGEAYIRRLRNGGVLVLASGPDDKVDLAAEIMNRQGAIGLQEISGLEAELPEPELQDAMRSLNTSVQVGRIREGVSGAQLFVW